MALCLMRCFDISDIDWVYTDPIAHEQVTLKGTYIITYNDLLIEVIVVNSMAFLKYQW
jgi:hypothetical protein